jgi:membrane-associated protease RseP (regulator of RpoE activity)
MSQNSETIAPPNVTTCANCHSPMPSELRFCRNCGFRLGEGLAEYNETMRFDSSHPQVVAASGAVVSRKRRRKITGMTWVFIGLLAFFVCAAAFTAIVTPFRPHVQFTAPVAARSYVGVDDFDTTDGGVTFDFVEAPGVPADKAGLVGGDVITVFDGKTVTEDDQMMDLLRQTPIGKTVDVTYIRDGEAKNTKLTTVSKEEYDGLVAAFRRRPEGTGLFGYEEGDSERVEIPATTSGTTTPETTTPETTTPGTTTPGATTPKTPGATTPKAPGTTTTPKFGVKLNTILRSRPADLAGVKEGDIVTKFGDTPIRTPREFRMRVLRAIPYSTITIEVIRDGAKLEIPVKMGKQ